MRFTMSNAKTASYTMRAIANYEKKVVKKAIIINPDSDSELLKAIENDSMAFGTRVKQLLKDFYKIS